MTLEGQAFAPLLCHFVLPYSNWEWACRCQSESLWALKKGVQEAVFRLGQVPPSGTKPTTPVARLIKSPAAGGHFCLNTSS